jgi:hypothetical protein
MAAPAWSNIGLITICDGMITFDVRAILREREIVDSVSEDSNAVCWKVPGWVVPFRCQGNFIPCGFQPDI